MSTVPRKASDAIPWVQAHITPWTTNAEMLKLDPLVVASLETLADLAESRRVALEAAETARANALLSFKQSVKDMRALAGGQVSIIRSTARNSAEPTTIYTLGGIPAPADPSPRPAPGTPVLFKIGLFESGALNVNFKCPNPPRVGALSYIVERSIGAQQPFVYLKTVPERFFEDNTVPKGSGDVTYRVTAQSSTKNGPPGYITVRFGVNNQPVIVSQGTSESAAS